MCLDDDVDLFVDLMEADSRTDGVGVWWSVASSPMSSLINVGLVNSLKLSERCAVNQCIGDQAAVLDLPSPVCSSGVDVVVEPRVQVGAGWQGVLEFQEDSVSGRDYPSGVGCTVADSNIGGEKVDALVDLLSVHQACGLDKVRHRAYQDLCDVFDCRVVDGLCVTSSSREDDLGIHFVQQGRCDQGVTMGRCYSRPGYADQFRSKHVPEECLVLVVWLYLTRVSGAWGVRGLTRMVFDPGGICYSFHFCTLVLSSPMQWSSIGHLCYNLQV